MDKKEFNAKYSKVMGPASADLLKKIESIFKNKSLNEEQATGQALSALIASNANSTYDLLYELLVEADK